MSTLFCPVCKKGMIPGELESERVITWYPCQPRQPSLRDYLSWKGIKELCAPFGRNILIPERDHWEKACRRLPAGYCPDCDRFVIVGRVKED